MFVQRNCQFFVAPFISVLLVRLLKLTPLKNSHKTECILFCIYPKLPLFNLSIFLPFGNSISTSTFQPCYQIRYRFDHRPNWLFCLIQVGNPSRPVFILAENVLLGKERRKRLVSLRKRYRRRSVRPSAHACVVQTVYGND